MMLSSSSSGRTHHPRPVRDADPVALLDAHHRQPLRDLETRLQQVHHHRHQVDALLAHAHAQVHAQPVLARHRGECRLDALAGERGGGRRLADQAPTRRHQGRDHLLRHGQVLARGQRLGAGTMDHPRRRPGGCEGRRRLVLQLLAEVGEALEAEGGQLLAEGLLGLVVAQDDLAVQAEQRAVAVQAGAHALIDRERHQAGDAAAAAAAPWRPPPGQGALDGQQLAGRDHPLGWQRRGRGVLEPAVQAVGDLGQQRRRHGGHVQDAVQGAGADADRGTGQAPAEVPGRIAGDQRQRRMAVRSQRQLPGTALLAPLRSHLQRPALGQRLLEAVGEAHAGGQQALHQLAGGAGWKRQRGLGGSEQRVAQDHQPAEQDAVLAMDQGAAAAPDGVEVVEALGHAPATRPQPTGEQHLHHPGAMVGELVQDVGQALVTRGRSGLRQLLEPARDGLHLLARSLLGQHHRRHRCRRMVLLLLIAMLRGIVRRFALRMVQGISRRILARHRPDAGLALAQDVRQLGAALLDLAPAGRGGLATLGQGREQRGGVLAALNAAGAAAARAPPGDAQHPVGMGVQAAEFDLDRIARSLTDLRQMTVLLQADLGDLAAGRIDQVLGAEEALPWCEHVHGGSGSPEQRRERLTASARAQAERGC